MLFYEKPYPAGFEALGLALVAILAVGNLLITLRGRRPDSIEFARPLALGGLALDIFIIGGFVWLFTFDPTSALWAILFILPLEGAISFSLSGALGAWAAATLLYAAREVWGSSHYGYPLLWNSARFTVVLPAADVSLDRAGTAADDGAEATALSLRMPDQSPA